MSDIKLQTEIEMLANSVNEDVSVAFLEKLDGFIHKKISDARVEAVQIAYEQWERRQHDTDTDIRQ